MMKSWGRIRPLSKFGKFFLPSSHLFLWHSLLIFSFDLLINRCFTLFLRLFIYDCILWNRLLFFWLDFLIGWRLQRVLTYKHIQLARRVIFLSLSITTLNIQNFIQIIEVVITDMLVDITNFLYNFIDSLRISSKYGCQFGINVLQKCNIHFIQLSIPIIKPITIFLLPFLRIFYLLFLKIAKKLIYGFTLKQF